MRGVRIACLGVLLAPSPGWTAEAADGGAPYGPATAQVSVCFVPEQSCGAAVANAIATATSFIRIQAYGLTSPVILRALAAARARGVDVQAVLDKSDERDHGKRVTGARFMVEANIPTWIDDSVAIAHNKVIIIDGHLVIGGSYNYTAAADHKNAENVTFIDAPVVADFYLLNWEARKAVSRPSRFEPDVGEEAPHEMASAPGR
jgi:phosphatidylserine/phosphatidylglycerophosphate/cardiolipin synthase-like enzyme